MGDAVKTARRSYHSPLRTEQADQTRRRILQAAFRLFDQRGYSGTTIAAIAAEAGVSPETIYLTFAGKRGLLEGVIATAIAGADDEPGEEDARWADAWQSPEPLDRLARMVEFSCGILARTRAMHAVIRGAADKEPFAAALGARLLRERLTGQTERIGRYLAGDLRHGLSVAEAGERYCALASPELYYLLTAEIGWSADQHRIWLTDLLAHELLGSQPS